MRHDLHYAFRTLLKTPGFSGIAILALALGIGANTAVFSVVNAVLLRPLPFKDPARLVMLWGNVKRAVVERRGASYPDYVDWRDRSRSFESMAAGWESTFTLYGTEEPERVRGEVVSAAYFPLLGAGAKVGRVFRPEEDSTPDVAPVAVIGEGFWKRHFGADPNVVGKTIQLDNRIYTVIGVAPENFHGLSDEAEIWVPVMASGIGNEIRERGSRWFRAVARLKPGVSRQQAQSELDGISTQLEKAYPETNEKRGVEVASLTSELTGDMRLPLLVILAAVGFVLLIACANVAGLLLARAAARQKEMAVRAALGAGRGRLLRQLIIESLVLTLTGAGVGVLLSLWGVDALIAASPVQFPSFVKVRLDPVVIAFTLFVSIAIGLALGIAPAYSTAPRLSEALKESSGRASANAGRQRLRSLLVVAEIGVALVLLAGAGLFIRSFQQLSTLDIGFRPEGLLTFRLSLPALPAPTQQTPSSQPDAWSGSAARRIHDVLSALPSIQAVSLASDLPLTGDSGAIFYTAEGQPPVTAQNMPRAYTHSVTPGFFHTLGVRLLRGRDFTPAELEGRDVVIVSEGVARRFWPAQDAIGKRIKAGRPASRAPWLQIVGVAGDVKYRGLPRNPTADPDLYFPFSGRARGFAVLVRSGVEPGSLVPAVRNEIRRFDKTAVIYNVAPMSEMVGRQIARSRFTSWLMGIFAAAAILLAMIGIYGVMAHLVSQRAQEIGIRMALGAKRGDVLRMIAARALALACWGVGIGVCLALALARLIRTMLFGVSAADPVVFGGVALLLIFVALLAAYVPARRAMRVDPAIALRYE